MPDGSMKVAEQGYTAAQVRALASSYRPGSGGLTKKITAQEEARGGSSS